MSLSSEDLLVQRQLRAAEIALETARRARRETDETMAQLRAAVDSAEAARERDALDYQSQLAASKARETVIQQKYLAEQGRREQLEQHLGALRHQGFRDEQSRRREAGEERLSQLEGELELVTRRAAEFEHGVRMAAIDAFKLVRDMTDKVGALLARAGLGDATQGSVGATSSDAEAVPGSADPSSDPPVTSMLDSERLDAALARLRTTTPSPQEPGEQ